MRSACSRKTTPVSHHSVALFCMPEIGHFQRLQALISGLADQHISVNVFTHRRFKSQTRRAGGAFYDLFSKYPLEEADKTSFPIPCRYVSFAAKYIKQIRSDVEKTRPSLLIHDSFAVIGKVVASLLGIPRVNVCAGHNLNPADFLASLDQDPRVKVSGQCLRAVQKLKESYGIADASPFSYISSHSPDLNIYCEPAEFLDAHERKAFEPVAFFGSLPSQEDIREKVFRNHPGNLKRSSRMLRVYVSFGTVVWRYYADAAINALSSLAAAFSQMKHVRAVISLGGATIRNGALAALSQPNVSVERYVDQWMILQNTDAFFTHHGMNSTHEALFHRVPMISYPFFSDQPALAEKCRQFGLAVPLTDSLRGEFSERDVGIALMKLSDKRDEMRVNLARAQAWEKEVVKNRPAVLKKIMDLVRG